MEMWAMIYNGGLLGFLITMQNYVKQVQMNHKILINLSS